MSDRRHLFVLAGTVLVLIAFAFGILKPRATQAADLRDDVAQAEAEEQVLLDRLANLREADANREALEAAVLTAELALPPHPHLIRTVRRLNRASLNAGVDLREIAPTAPADEAPHNGARTINVSLIVKGRYDRIEAFVTQLEQLERAMKVTSMTFTPEQEGSRTVLTVAIQAIMFTYDPNASAAQPPATEEAAS